MKSMFFIMCLRSMVVRALERYVNTGPADLLNFAMHICVIITCISIPTVMHSSAHYNSLRLVLLG